MREIKYLLDTDVNLKVYFIGDLKRRNNERDACYHLMKIKLITENETLFEDEKSINSLLDRVSSKLKTMCPNTQYVQVVAQTSLKDDPYSSKDLFFSIQGIKRKNAWNFDMKNAQNYVLQRKLARIRQANNDYVYLKEAKRKARLAYLHDVSLINNPLEISLVALAKEEPVASTFLVEVVSVNGATVKTGWPVEMTINDDSGQINDEGWYVVSGEVEASEKAVDDYGYPLMTMDVDKVKRCKKESCKEASDVIELIRTKRNLVDWKPAH